MTTNTQSTEQTTTETQSEQDLGRQLIEISERSKKVSSKEAGIVTNIEEENGKITISFERANQDSYTHMFDMPGYCPPEETHLSEIDNELLRFCRSEETPYTFESFVGDGMEDEPVPIVESRGEYDIWVPSPSEPTLPRHQQVYTSVQTFIEKLTAKEALFILSGLTVGSLGFLSLLLVVGMVLF